MILACVVVQFVLSRLGRRRATGSASGRRRGCARRHDRVLGCRWTLWSGRAGDLGPALG